MAVNNEVICGWNQLPERTVNADTIRAQTIIYKGHMAMRVGGVITSLNNGFSTLNGFMLIHPGSGINGQLIIYALQHNVRYIQLGGVSQTLGVSVVFSNSTTDVIVQLGTDGGGNPTSTAVQVRNAILAHALASKLLRIQYNGSGNATTSATVGVDPLPVPHFYLIGVAEETYDNAASLTNTTMRMRFNQGVVDVATTQLDPVTLAMTGGMVGIFDSVTVRATPQPLDYQVKLIDISTNGIISVDIAA